MPEELRIPVLRIDPHPFYIGHPDFLNDIALVTLSTGIHYHDGVKPICLPHPTFITANQTVTQIGYQNPEITEERISTEEACYIRLVCSSMSAILASYYRATLYIFTNCRFLSGRIWWSCCCD
uniref:Serine protease 45 n=1 Tax=Lygus hesperus TaxID=30085 RepID=A0A0A9WBZ1_LYGHE